MKISDRDRDRSRRHDGALARSSAELTSHPEDCGRTELAATPLTAPPTPASTPTTPSDYPSTLPASPRLHPRPTPPATPRRSRRP
ncbi:hypothetical protein PUN28_002344 [Cardiocondyla obscurior]|uniref:Histone H3 n=1 Tax=Cardiocondyla obscurior TaxID=286306 RepID=A0AAW2GTP0_9HYME